MKKTLLTLSLLGGLALSAQAHCGKCEGKKGDGSHREKVIEKFDKDGDGELNEEERKAAREAMHKGHKRPHLSREEMLEKFDTDGDGELSETERKAAHEAKKAKMLEKFDTDGDGELSEEERKAAREAMHKHHKGPHGKGKRKGGKEGKGGKKSDPETEENFEELSEEDFAE